MLGIFSKRDFGSQRTSRSWDRGYRELAAGTKREKKIKHGGGGEGEKDEGLQNDSSSQPST